MAIYNLNRINQVCNNQSYDLQNSAMLDDMMEACDYMISMLDESKHGSAYRRYMNMQADKQQAEKDKSNGQFDKHSAKAENLGGKALGASRNAAVKDDGSNTRALYNRGSNKYVRSGDSDIKKAVEDDDKAARDDYGKRSEVHWKRENWKQDHGDKMQWGDEGKDKPGKYKTSEGLSTKYDPKADNMKKAEAVKEACFYILSRLDDIMY